MSVDCMRSALHPPTARTRGRCLTPFVKRGAAAISPTPRSSSSGCGRSCCSISTTFRSSSSTSDRGRNCSERCRVPSTRLRWTREATTLPSEVRFARTAGDRSPSWTSLQEGSLARSVGLQPTTTSRACPPMEGGSCSLRPSPRSESGRLQSTAATCSRSSNAGVLRSGLLAATGFCVLACRLDLLGVVAHCPSSPRWVARSPGSSHGVRRRRSSAGRQTADRSSS